MYTVHAKFYRHVVTIEYFGQNWRVICAVGLTVCCIVPVLISKMNNNNHQRPTCQICVCVCVFTRYIN